MRREMDSPSHDGQSTPRLWTEGEEASEAWTGRSQRVYCDEMGRSAKQAAVHGMQHTLQDALEPSATPASRVQAIAHRVAPVIRHGESKKQGLNAVRRAALPTAHCRPGRRPACGARSRGFRGAQGCACHVPGVRGLGGGGEWCAGEYGRLSGDEEGERDGRGKRL